MDWGRASRAGGDGSIVAWGRKLVTQCEVASPTTEFAAAGAWDFRGVALKADGTVVAWGNDFWGISVPQPNTGFVAVAAGYYIGLGIRAVPPATAVEPGLWTFYR